MTECVCPIKQNHSASSCIQIQLGSLYHRLNAVETRMAEIDTRLASLWEEIDSRHNAVWEIIDDMLDRIDAIEAYQEAHDATQALYGLPIAYQAGTDEESTQDTAPQGSYPA